jgi:quercetin dioxygenase-like cupin family protein
MRGAAAAMLLALSAAAGCGTDEDADRGSGDALGGSARTRTLARVTVQGRTASDVAWDAHEVRLAAGARVRHEHELGFAYARRGRQALAAGGRVSELTPGKAAAVGAGRVHTHEPRGGDAALWEIRLAPRDSALPEAPGARRVFRSEPLEGVPPRPEASLIEVVVPAEGGRTTVHTHPGPEFIYQVSGRIQYQNAIIGTKLLRPGGSEGIPPGTPVQKRNPYERPATFLSLFLVDPAKPFAPEARF